MYRWRRASHPAVEDRRRRLAEADAHRLQAVALVLVLEGVEQRGHDPRAGRAERVADRDRTSPDVDLRPVRADVLAPRGGDGREGLVDLEQIDVLHPETGALQDVL